MSPFARARWRVLEPLFDQALDLRPEALRPWLDALHEWSPEIARDLEQLLRSSATIDDEGFLVGPVPFRLHERLREPRVPAVEPLVRAPHEQADVRGTEREGDSGTELR